MMTEQEKIDKINKNGPDYLNKYKPENITYNMCLAAVKNYGSALRYVPEEYRSEEIYAVACRNDGEMLWIVPTSLRSHELCLDAVSSKGEALRYVPEHLKTEDICFAALRKDIDAIKYVPEDILTPDFLHRLFQTSSYRAADATKKYAATASMTELISKLPKSLKTAKYYKELLEKIPGLIWCIPQKYISLALCKGVIKTMGYSSVAEAVEDEPSFFNLLPVSMLDHNACLAYVRSGMLRGGLHPGEKRDKVLSYYDACLEVVKELPFLVSSIPPEYQTEEIYQLAIQTDINIFRVVPEKLVTEAICEAAFEKDPGNIKYIPEKYITEEMSLAAVKSSGYLLKYVPDQVKTREMCEIAINSTESGFDFIPKHLFDEDLALQVINSPSTYGLYVLDRIPKSVINSEICFAAVRRSAREIERVPKELLTYELCLAAVEENGGVLREIPSKYYTEELLIAAVKSGGWRTFIKIPPELITEAIIITGIEREGSNGSPGKILEKVSDEMMTFNIAMKVACVRPWDLDCIPDRFRTKEVLLKGVERAEIVVRFIPESLQYKEFILEMIAINPKCRELLKTEDWYLAMDHSNQ